MTNCPVCNRGPNAYLNCNRPDCMDGRNYQQHRQLPPLEQWEVVVENRPTTEFRWRKLLLNSLVAVMCAVAVYREIIGGDPTPALVVAALLRMESMR